MIESKRKLLGLTLADIQKSVKELGMPGFTAKQIAEWVYNKHVNTIDEMSNISIKNREVLSQHFEVGKKQPAEVMESVDGTKKYLFEVGENRYVEAVFIPDKERGTLCVSSQVGCKMGCLFCMTGKQGFSSQLTTNDILNQIFSLPEFTRLTNLVFMGMGEPCDNLSNLLPALGILTAQEGMGWSPHRITVSSIGIRKGLKELIEGCECHIAISIHHGNSEKRAQLMPAEKGYPIKDIVDLLKNYDFSHQRRLSFEYIVFDKINDSIYNARELVKLLNGLDCRINLIRYHAIPEIPLNGVNDEQMTDFRDYLTRNGLFTTIRASRGEDIFAACGMLSTLKNKNQDKINSI